MTEVVPAWQAIGVFGGTFDPIHFGHLRTAFECRVRLGLDEVRFVPCADPPHRGAPAAPADIRLRMVQAAVEQIDGFVADPREYERSGPSYTVETLCDLSRDFPRRPLCLILGLDAFATLDRWRDWEALFDHAHVVVARRPGASMPVSGAVRAALRERGAATLATLAATPVGRIFIIDVTQLDISSTDLRASIAAGIRPVYLLPDPVWQVILEARCYGARS